MRAASPNCSECARPLAVVEPFIGGVPQHHRCPGCLVHLRVCRTSAGWTVTTAARSAGQGEPGSVPAVASPALRHRFLSACRGVRKLLQRDGVEPGMASIEEVRHG